MEPMEIILLIAGGLIFILSFFISDTKTASGERKELSKDEAERLADQELAKLRGKIDMLTQEVLGEAMERTKRSLEKLSNEKIMAVNEYSDTVLTEIHKNHEEAMFLYDMLNNKHTSLKNAIGEINRAVKDAEAVREAFARPVQEEEVRDEALPQGQSAFNGRSAGWTEASSVPMPFYMAASEQGEQTSERPEGMGQEQADLSWIQEGQERNNNLKILELYRQGKSVVSIAKELDLGVGEVKLVVDLFKNQ